MWFFGGHRHLNENRLSDYVSGRLTLADRARLERTADECATCREELESLQQTRALLQALPPEPLPRSFVFAEAPAMAAAEVYRPTQVTGFRMPGWAYAGAAAVAGLAVIVFVLSGTVGTWLPRGDGEEFEAMASASATEATREMASIPRPTAMPGAFSEVQPAAQAAPFFEEPMAESQGFAESGPEPLEDAVGQRETGAVAEAPVEVEKEVVVERIVETETVAEPTAEPFVAAMAPAAAPEMAEEPRIMAMAEAPTSTPAPAAAPAQEASARETGVEVPVEAEVIVPDVAGEPAATEPTQPALTAGADAFAAAPAGEAPSSAEEVEATPSPGPVVEGGKLGPPALAATERSAAALGVTPLPPEIAASPLPKDVGQAAAPKPTLAARTATPVATKTVPTPTVQPTAAPGPTMTLEAAASARIETEAAGATEPPGQEAEGPGPEAVAGVVEPRGPAGQAGAQSATGAAVPTGDAAEPGRGSSGLPAMDESATMEEAGIRDQWALPSAGNLATVALIAVGAVAVGVVAALVFVRRIRAGRKGTTRPGTNQEPDASLIVNHPRLEN